MGNSEYTSLQLFSDEDGSPAGQVLIAVIVSDCSFLIMIVCHVLCKVWFVNKL